MEVRGKKKRVGKTTDLVKKIRDQRNISCKDGHYKGKKQQRPKRNGKN